MKPLSLSKEIREGKLSDLEIIQCLDMRHNQVLVSAISQIVRYDAIQIAKAYQKKHNVYGVIHDEVERSVKYYREFYRIKGSAWLVLADISPKTYEGDDEITFVISDEEGIVDHVLDHNGIPHRYHLASKRNYTDEEFEAILNDDDE